MKLKEVIEFPKLIRYYNASEWKNAAKKKGFKISQPMPLAGDGKTKMYYAFDPKNTKEGENAGQMIDYGKGHVEGHL